MNLHALDWAIVAAYFAFSTIVGLVFTKRGGESLNEYFLSGRDVPWWLAGTSMVATTFAADTPLLVTGLVANHGVAGNWLWWNMVMSGMLTVFFFARLWRRSGVMTDVEFAEIRYSGKPAAVLRGFRALYLGLLMNVLIMGWVTRAMIKILTISLGINPITAVAICFVATVLYAAAGGLWAVLWTDLVQFIIKMGAVIVLAVYAVHAVGGIDKLKAGVTAHFGSETAALSVLPIAHGPHGFQAYAWMPLLTISVFIAVQWWASWYPGAEPGGGGYVAQRIFAAKTERDGVLATLLFQVAHYALRPWPWIVTGLATVILYPNLVDKESGYVHAYVDLLPTPWRGVMMAGFAAAYMSTIGTQLNWGASYLVNDFYKRFIRRDASDKHYVAASRLATIGLFAVAIAVTTQLSSIERVQKYLLAIGAGTGLVLILRWYWMRINAWSELSAMIGSLVVSTIAMQTIFPRFAPGDPNADAWVMIVTVGATTVIWLSVTLLTPKEPAHVLDAFIKRVRPYDTQWGPAWANWVAGIVAVYATLFGIGKLVFKETGAGLGLIALAIAAFAWIGRSFRIYLEDTRRSEG
jgi:Na+/proline symporter